MSTLLTDVSRIMAEVAAAEVMPRWRNLGTGDVSEKTGPDDLVTIADRGAELALTERLASYLPGSLVVGEEAVSADASVMRRLQERGPVWVIDPIDGTQAFAGGEPDFTVMVALVEDGRATAGWIYAPALGEIAYGGKDHGVWMGRDGKAPTSVARADVPARVGDMIGLLGKRNRAHPRNPVFVQYVDHDFVGCVRLRTVEAGRVLVVLVPHFFESSAHFSASSAIRFMSSSLKQSVVV